MDWVCASTDFVTAEGAALFRPKNLTVEDESDEGEQRFVTIGTNSFGSLTVVVHTHRGDDIRLISVRKSDPTERRFYEKGI